MRKNNMKLWGIIAFNNRSDMQWYLDDAKKSGYTLVYINNAALMYKK